MFASLAADVVRADPPEPFDYKAPPAAPSKEEVVAIPEYPKDRNLVVVPMGSGDTLKLFVDRASFSRTDDGVWRATLVLESASGARSVYYDGIRCETREYQTYAIGPVAGGLAPVKAPVWRSITNLSTNAFHWRLLRYYACDDYANPRDLRAFLQSLNEPLNP